jgi:hypothetical protein
VLLKWYERALPVHWRNRKIAWYHYFVASEEESCRNELVARFKTFPDTWMALASLLFQIIGKVTEVFMKAPVPHNFICAEHDGGQKILLAFLTSCMEDLLMKRGDKTNFICGLMLKKQILGILIEALEDKSDDEEDEEEESDERDEDNEYAGLVQTLNECLFAEVHEAHHEAEGDTEEQMDSDDSNHLGEKRKGDTSSYEEDSKKRKR